MQRSSIVVKDCWWNSSVCTFDPPLPGLQPVYLISQADNLYYESPDSFALHRCLPEVLNMLTSASPLVLIVLAIGRNAMRYRDFWEQNRRTEEGDPVGGRDEARAPLTQNGEFSEMSNCELRGQKKRQNIQQQGFPRGHPP